MRRPLVTLALAALSAAALSGASLLAAPDPLQWKGVALVKPEELAATLKKPGGKPVLLHVGFRVLYDQAHIPGSIYAGPGRDAAGTDAAAAERLAQAFAGDEIDTRDEEDRKSVV